MSKGHYIITQELLIYWQNILLRYAGAGGGETDLSAPHVHPVDLHFLNFQKMILYRFSAYWLRSSVVSVLISLISGMVGIAGLVY